MPPEHTVSTYVPIRGRHPVLYSLEVLQRPYHTHAGTTITVASPPTCEFTPTTLRNRRKLGVHHSDGSPVRSLNIQGVKVKPLSELASMNANSSGTGLVAQTTLKTNKPFGLCGLLVFRTVSETFQLAL